MWAGVGDEPVFLVFLVGAIVAVIQELILNVVFNKCSGLCFVVGCGRNLKSS